MGMASGRAPGTQLSIDLFVEPPFSTVVRRITCMTMLIAAAAAVVIVATHGALAVIVPILINKEMTIITPISTLAHICFSVTTG